MRYLPFSQQVYLILCAFVSACAGPSSYHRTRIPTGGWHHATERPYRDRGTLYIPQQHYVYAAEGVATWYGPECHGHPTAMGVCFNMNAVSAAHRTLPLPCVVRVTNLENGRKMRILVNDRGPFLDVRRRIIDISRQGAQLLGYYHKGKAHVRVECLPAESYQMALAYKRKPYALPRGVRKLSLQSRPIRAKYKQAIQQRSDKARITHQHASSYSSNNQKNAQKKASRSLDAVYGIIP
ncbi:MAG: septal ring lytic transglycosylase RlpA family protein [Holosporales bacterium]|jgi:rare lipoprotein A|nr:septal ring lytic transglycosylase RlpA family protein [Holosporales bacterium]